MPAVAAALAALATVASAAAAADVPTWAYRIEPGDTLIGLHARFMRQDARWQRVQKLNRIADPLRLRPGSLLQIPVAMLRGEPVAAEALHVHGQVEVERDGGGRQALSAASLLREGDVIVTGAQSSASVRFADGSTTLLGPDGRLRIERHARLAPGGPTETRLRLDVGATETRVVPARPAPRFELRTPVVNLGVRGTEFRGRVAGDVVVAEVLSGRVAAGRQAVDAGFGTVASGRGVEPPRVLPAPPAVETGPLLLERMPLQFNFNPVPGAAAYRAQVFSAEGAERLLLEGVFAVPRAQWSQDLPDGRYELRLRAALDSGIEGRATRQAFTLKARPTAPFPLTPRSGEKQSPGNIDFSWARHPEAEHYKLQVSATPDFQMPVLDRSDLTDNGLRMALPAGSFYWRVATVRKGNDSGPWSDPAPFTLEPPPPAPSTQAPQVDKAGILLRWAASSDPGVRYQVQVARDPDFTQFVVDETTTLTERLLPAPGPGMYHIRVRSVGADGRAGAFGTAQAIEVPHDLTWLWLLPLLLLFL